MQAADPGHQTGPDLSLQRVGRPLLLVAQAPRQAGHSSRNVLSSMLPSHWALKAGLPGCRRGRGDVAYACVHSALSCSF